MTVLQDRNRSAEKSKRAAATQRAPRSRLLSHAEAHALGKKLRDKCPRNAHARWKVPQNRRDAVDLMLAAEKGRVPDLLPLRHGRMARSAFTFYRGAALTMASDLATTPVSGLTVQCCGDAHLSNFGGFANPERRVIFAINYLDETLPAPWEWDVKRLAASFVVACRDNALSDSCARDAAQTCVRTYRESMAEFGEMKTLELWYQSIAADDLVARIKDPALRARAVKRLQKEKGRSIAEDIFPKIAEHHGEMPLIKDQLPTIFHHVDAPPGVIHQAVMAALEGYRSTLSPATQSLLARYELRDAAIKVVGIGSVGTQCWVLLYMAGEADPLFLQVKEARASVLEAFAGASAFPDHGHRVVDGYRRIQPASDLFLGWTKTSKHHYFVRQLRDIKISIRVETFERSEMELYATWCGRALALSHARSGAARPLSGYMGRSDTFEKAITRFAIAYADQNEKDHAALAKAIRAGKVEAVTETEEES